MSRRRSFRELECEIADLDGPQPEEPPEYRVRIRNPETGDWEDGDGNVVDPPEPGPRDIQIGEPAPEHE